MKEVRSWKKAFESDLENIVSELKDTLDKPAVVILSGPVGAGKTTLAKVFMGDNKGTQIQSPTYSLVQEKDDTVHADLYRLESAAEIVHLELELYLEDKNYFLVEWGLDYLSSLKREVGHDFYYYELKIEANNSDDSENKNSSRNYILRNIN